MYNCYSYCCCQADHQGPWTPHPHPFCDFCFIIIIFSSACATTQQSDCRHVGIRRPSIVKPIFSEPVKQINAKFGGKVPLTISIPVIFFFEFKAFDFYIFFFSFSLTWDHMGKKLQTTSPLKVLTKFTPKKSCILLGGSLPKLYKDWRNFKFWIFTKFLPFSLT